MKRRDFLKAAMAGAVTGSGMLLKSPTRGQAWAAPLLPTIVVIFQRGGCDGLNTVVPYADPNYAGLRPTIGIAPPDNNNPLSALDLDGFFGLHPAMSDLLPIYQAGDLAVMPSVQYPDYSRSHFSSQKYIENAVRSTESDGWLNRMLAGSSGSTDLRAVHFGGSLAQSMRGDVPVSSFSSLGSFNLGLSDQEEQTVIDGVLPSYLQAAEPDTAYRDLVQRFGRLLFGNLNTVLGLDPSGYTPANNAVYPNTSYGRRLREIAYLIKEPTTELEVATVDIGGWDTHSSQGGGESGGRHARRLSEFSQGVAALYNDLGPMMNQVIILTMTEFGRTAKENGSQGTDHGVASSWFALGNNINGGIHNGANGWPGLSEQDLIRGRYLNYTMNHRDIMGDILSNHMGINNLSSILPGHSYQPAGLFS